MEMVIEQFRFNAVDAVACSEQQGQIFSEHGWLFRMKMKAGLGLPFSKMINMQTLQSITCKKPKSYNIRVVGEPFVSFVSR